MIEVIEEIWKPIKDTEKTAQGFKWEYKHG